MFPKWRTKCRACTSAANGARLKERYENDAEFAAKAKERAAEWQRKNAERANEYQRRRHAAKMAEGDKEYVAKMDASQRKYRESKKGKKTITARMKAYEASGQMKAWRDARRTQPESRTSQMLGSTRNRAIKLNIKFELTFDDIYPSVLSGRCAVTGLPFDLTPHTDHRVHPFAPSIDRIVPKKGYVRGNVQIVCWAYNAARNQWGDDVLLKLARAIVDAHNKSGV